MPSVGMSVNEDPPCVICTGAREFSRATLPFRGMRWPGVIQLSGLHARADRLTSASTR